MFKLIIFVSVIGSCFAIPPRHHLPGGALAKPTESSLPVVPKIVGVKSQTGDIEPDGSYYFSYETDTGDKFSQTGVLKTVNEAPIIAVDGTYSYTGNDGNVYTVTFTADENGYVPVGEHIPQVPEYIAKSLKYIADHPPKEE